ncbi:sulfite reductase [Niastella yeongjuensis]|uniref:assimilatory sulfite reductase (NADPH) n=1 Tax=Niastella yeongjuensis TaxID=354355 RepID=A0A1V9EYG9_9BACT|nr:flavodoxin domain-containing protein [Niastella yeongjuensis]OQP51015.1 sulfite reductase [Niastella yeongjuensis]SEN06846.1 sulfite reductase (NADPH) flavoprotein alpha-component [Niastella yeongjuensis]
MLAEHKLKLLQDLVRTSTKEELVWMNGFLAGVLMNCHDQSTLASSAPSASAPATAAAPVAAPVESKPTVSKITIAYGTETGNSKKLATELAAKAKKSGIQAKVVGLDTYRLNDLAKEEYFFAIISTQGEGEPPTTAKKFYDHIHQNGFKLPQMKFGVLALGDTSYPLYCKAGEDVDQQLQKLGGQRVVNLIKCDVDYQGDADGWFSQVLHSLTTTTSSNGTASVGAVVTAKKPAGKKVYNGSIITNVNLNDRGSNKATHHIEIVADELEYQPGDSIGVIPENAPAIVDAIIALTRIDAKKTVSFRNETHTVIELLKKKVNIAYLPERVVKQYAAIVKQDIPETKISLLDLLKIYPVNNAAQFEEVIGILEPITPRLYSISSSPNAHSGEVHVTVARDNFKMNGEVKHGLASNFLADLPVDGPLEFYVHKNNQFRLPAEDKDVIMIGPGTGIAPFRSFIAERDAAGASGRNWLFFGDQHFTTDFLYQTEIQSWIQTGVLTKVNVAFSRDQKSKIYVQHKMLENAKAFYEWLQNGAYVYICGAKEPMSVDVEYTILQIIERFGSKSGAEAVEYLNQLKEEGRFLKDVY